MITWLIICDAACLDLIAEQSVSLTASDAKKVKRHFRNYVRMCCECACVCVRVCVCVRADVLAQRMSTVKWQGCHVSSEDESDHRWHVWLVKQGHTLVECHTCVIYIQTTNYISSQWKAVWLLSRMCVGHKLVISVALVQTPELTLIILD